MSQHNARTEKYLVVIDDDEEGRRRARRYPLNLPLALVTAVRADGSLDLSSPRISDRALSDMRHDLEHELRRRAGTLHELGGWTPGAPSRQKARLSERNDKATTERDAG